MRELHDHKTNDMNKALKVVASDEPGPGGANHVYRITGFEPPANARDGAWWTEMLVNFQNGPAKEAGINGLTHEVLLAILIDRLTAFANGPMPDAFTVSALVHCEQALSDLKMRTDDRVARGVEGTSQK